MNIFFKEFHEDNMIKIVIAGMEEVKISFEKPTEKELLEHLDGVIYSAVVSSLNELRQRREDFNLEQQPSDDFKKFFELPASLAAKILLYKIMLKHNFRAVDLTKKLNISPAAVGRLLDFTKKSEIDGIQEALKVTGYDLVMDAKVR